MDQLGIKEIMHVKRFLSMIKDGDDKSSQNDFKTLSVNGARQIIKKFIVDENTVEKLVECVESESLCKLAFLTGGIIHANWDIGIIFRNLLAVRAVIFFRVNAIS